MAICTNTTLTLQLLHPWHLKSDVPLLLNTRLILSVLRLETLWGRGSVGACIC